MSKLKIVYKPIDELIPYINNSRTHSDSQVAQIASSIKEFGWTNPILLDGKNGIIAGHGRLMAGRLLGETQVPTIELGHLTESQKKAYVIADNKIAINANWDDELLKIELESLSETEKTMTAFSPEELNFIFNGWQSDIEAINEIEPTDESAKEKILILCDPDDEKRLRDEIKSLVEALGLVNAEIK